MKGGAGGGRSSQPTSADARGQSVTHPGICLSVCLRGNVGSSVFYMRVSRRLTTHLCGPIIQVWVRVCNCAFINRRAGGQKPNDGTSPAVRGL